MKRINGNRFVFCVATPEKYASISVDSIRKQKHIVQPGLSIVTKNKKSLCKVYNQFIDEALARDTDWIILMHDDVELEITNVCDRILNTGYDVVGVAGTTKVELRPPALWHLMGGSFQSGNLRGAVAHGSSIGQERLLMTSFGPYPARCVMIDGVFMAISRKVFENVRFDESNPAKFHFYDLSYSLECHEKGYKVGVGNIPIIHESPGLREFTDEWKAGEKWFLEKFGNGSNPSS